MPVQIFIFKKNATDLAMLKSGKTNNKFLKGD